MSDGLYSYSRYSFNSLISVGSRFLLITLPPTPLYILDKLKLTSNSFSPPIVLCLFFFYFYLPPPHTPLLLLHDVFSLSLLYSKFCSVFPNKQTFLFQEICSMQLLLKAELIDKLFKLNSKIQRGYF